jgi:hypothetical protein
MLRVGAIGTKQQLYHKDIYRWSMPVLSGKVSIPSFAFDSVPHQYQLSTALGRTSVCQYLASADQR